MTKVYTLSPAEMFSSPDSLIMAEHVRLRQESQSHAHEFAEVALVTAGAANHITDSGLRSLRPGTLLILGPGAWHAYADPRNLTLLNLYLDPQLLAQPTPTLAGLPVTDVILEELRTPGLTTTRELDLSTTRSLTRALSAIATVRDPSLLQQLSLFYSVADMLSRTSANHPPLHAVPLNQEDILQDSNVLHYSPRVSRAISLLHAELARAWSLTALATQLHVSPSQLARAFRDDLNTGPMAYLQQLRARHMAYLLRASGLTVAAAGAAVGWRDPSYASRRFSAHWGMPPAAYRARTQVSLGSATIRAIP